MAPAGFNFREIRIVIEDEITRCWVLLEALGDCPLGVQGWHYQAFPSFRTVEDILKESAADAAMWPQDIPRGWRENREASA